ncbi:hypothetical protein L6R50_16370 [Myxococcota bacterium]|nr:hypothetical protein [Myxococcota bacterium]
MHVRNLIRLAGLGAVLALPVTALAVEGGKACPGMMGESGPRGLPLYPNAVRLSDDQLQDIQESDAEGREAEGQEEEVLEGYVTGDDAHRVMARMGCALMSGGWAITETEIETDIETGSPVALEYEVVRNDPDTGEEVKAEVELLFDAPGHEDKVVILYEGVKE